MKEIVLLGNLKDSEFTNYLIKSSKFKINKLQRVEAADKVINKTNPDYVLCSGRIRVDEDGNYYLEL